MICDNFETVTPNSIAFEANYVTVVENRHIMSAEYPLPLLVKSDPTQQSL